MTYAKSDAFRYAEEAAVRFGMDTPSQKIALADAYLAGYLAAQKGAIADIRALREKLGM